MTTPPPLPTAGELDRVMKEHLSGEPEVSRRSIPAARAPAAGVWQPIETAPTDATPILAIDTRAPEPSPAVVHFWEAQWCGGRPEDWGDPIAASRVLGVYYPTHWMPLPAPPQ